MAQASGDRPHLLDEIEELLPFLANERITQLVTQPSDIGSQRRVSCLDVHRTIVPAARADAIGQRHL
jgi:hypothetical protein